MRRQFNCYLGQTPGRPDAELVRKVLENRHAKREATAQRAQVYHLCSHPFYRAIGQGENRHRRDRAPLAVKAKLMGLDFVLAHPNVEYLATEQDKLDYFHCRLGIDLDTLPQKTYRSGDGRAAHGAFLHREVSDLSGGPAKRRPACGFVLLRRRRSPFDLWFRELLDSVWSAAEAAQAEHGSSTSLTRSRTFRLPSASLSASWRSSEAVREPEKARTKPRLPSTSTYAGSTMRGSSVRSTRTSSIALAATCGASLVPRLERRYEAWRSGNRQESGAAERLGSRTEARRGRV